MSLTLLELLLQESKALPMVSNLGLWPASHVVAGTRVSSTVRRVLMQACAADNTRLCVDLRLRCPERVSTQMYDTIAQEDAPARSCTSERGLVGFDRWSHAHLLVEIAPKHDACVPVCVFRELDLAIYSGKCRLRSLNLSGCNWSAPDGNGIGHYGPQLEEVEVCSVTMATEQEEAHIYQAIAHSSSLHSLVWGNLTPLAEVIDMRRLAPVLGASLTHLDLSGHRLDIDLHLRAMIDNFPRLDALQCLSLRHTRLDFECSSAAQDDDVADDFQAGFETDTFSGLNELMTAMCKLGSLQELDLSGNSVSTRGAARLSRHICRMPALERLGLRSAKLEDTSASHLANILQSCRLHTLDLALNDMSYFGKNVVLKSSVSNRCSVIFGADESFLTEVAILGWTNLRDCSDALASSVLAKKPMVLEIVVWWWEALEIVAEPLKNDVDVFAACLRCQIGQGWRALELAGDAIRSDIAQVRAACRQDLRALEFAADSVKQDKKFVLELIQGDRDGHVLRRAGIDLQVDRDVVLAALHHSGGYALRFTVASLRADREVVMAALRGGGGASVLNMADEGLREDSELKVAAQYWSSRGGGGGVGAGPANFLHCHYGTS